MMKQKLKLMLVKVDSFENYRPRYKKDLLLLIYFSEERTGNKQISDAKTRQQQQFLLFLLIQKFKEQKNKSSKNKRIRILELIHLINGC